MEETKKDYKEKITQIHANMVKLIVTDDDTGKTFEREIPLEYLENDNGIILRGENCEAVSSEIVFLSDVAMRKIVDVTGAGLDRSRCGDHEHEHKD